MMIKQFTTSSQTPLFVTCGMYSFTDDLRNAWQQFFSHFLTIAKPAFEVNKLLRFETGTNLLDDPSLWFGHTCGYPLMTQFRDTLTPICVPVFDVAGCDQINYSSRLVVSRDSKIETLLDCRGLRAVINGDDSNSGMNLLRHAVASVNQQGSFFGQIMTSGSHLQSLTEVANRRADIAAIDCVSYQLIQDTWPQLTDRVRSIGFTTKTCGLPFVIGNQRAAKSDRGEITRSLNSALQLLDADNRSKLHLMGFEDVNTNDYQGILDLEIYAQEAGYPVLS